MAYYIVNPDTQEITRHVADDAIFDKLVKMDHRHLDWGRVMIYFWKADREKEKMWTLTEEPTEEGGWDIIMDFYGTCYITGAMCKNLGEEKYTLRDIPLNENSLRDIISFP
uniref:Uncharacterized protein n=1 Tax=Marseillevirus LCMAC102 TaxID=2506603 RepID=A0A481YUP0_9VIRU|nr:MAG: hypothetical protein LCMAC102_02900 [Marseillevirus LCMAC102]